LFVIFPSIADIDFQIFELISMRHQARRMPITGAYSFSSNRDGKGS
jgi:hypothetical protein